MRVADLRGLAACNCHVQIKPRHKIKLQRPNGPQQLVENKAAWDWHGPTVSHNLRRAISGVKRALKTVLETGKL